jgi:hypothetical protein
LGNGKRTSEDRELARVEDMAYKWPPKAFDRR